jgi:hypothetical protein
VGTPGDRQDDHRAAGERRLAGERVERAIFAMVSNRLSVKPLSKLAGCGWVAERAFIEGLAAVSDDECYRAMDFLHAALPELQERVFFTVASLLDLEVDLLFFDTSSTYWETDRLPDELHDQDDAADTDEPDEEPALQESGRRRYSKNSKDHRPGSAPGGGRDGGHAQGDPGQGVDVPRQCV